MLIMASRPIGAWFKNAGSYSIAEGSKYDRIVLSILIFLGIWILSNRRMDWSKIIKDNRLLILLYVYLGISILWSDYPFISFKRWFKITGTVVMSFVILSEDNPLKALLSILRRSAYILIPLSIVLIKYFPEYGVQYSRWEGVRMATGVTTHKNSLGVLCAFSSLTLIWAFFRGRKMEKAHWLRAAGSADLLVIAISLFLLFGGESGTYSATSILIFSVGMLLYISLERTKSFSSTVSNNFRMLVLVGVVVVVLFRNLLLPPILESLGRNETLTDRAYIWASVLAIASRHPVLGTGYGGFWGLKSEAITSRYGVLQAHNGYLDVYLQVGVIGIIFLSLFLLELCGKARNMTSYDKDLGVLSICFVIMILLYNYSEAGFIETNCMWTIAVFLTGVLTIPSLYEKRDNVNRLPP